VGKAILLTYFVLGTGLVSHFKGVLISNNVRNLSHCVKFPARKSSAEEKLLVAVKEVLAISFD
jgi:hypothetical protein